jgi:hypothetical protein
MVAMQATTALPPGYVRLATLDLSRSRGALASAIILGIFLLLGVAWLLVQAVRLLRPAALDSIRYRTMFGLSEDGAFSLNVPLLDFLAAMVLVLLLHELVHGLAYWWFARRRPRFGVAGLLPYASVPPGVYFPRNQYLAVGLAPLLLLTGAGLLLLLVLPLATISVLTLFIVLNAAGAAGDLVVVARLLSFAPDTLMEDAGAGTIVYGPAGAPRR